MTTYTINSTDNISLIESQNRKGRTFRALSLPLVFSTNCVLLFSISVTRTLRLVVQNNTGLFKNVKTLFYHEIRTKRVKKKIFIKPNSLSIQTFRENSIID